MEIYIQYLLNLTSPQLQVVSQRTWWPLIVAQGPSHLPAFCSFVLKFAEQLSTTTTSHMGYKINSKVVENYRQMNWDFLVAGWLVEAEAFLVRLLAQNCEVPWRRCCPH